MGFLNAEGDIYPLQRATATALRGVPFATDLPPTQGVANSQFHVFNPPTTPTPNSEFHFKVGVKIWNCGWGIKSAQNYSVFDPPTANSMF